MTTQDPLAALREALDSALPTTATGGAPSEAAWLVKARLEERGYTIAATDPPVRQDTDLAAYIRAKGRWPEGAHGVTTAATPPAIDPERLARAIADHDDICSRMAIPECAAAIIAAYEADTDA